MGPLFLGIDVGASAVKTVIFDEFGRSSVEKSFKETGK
jgi:sugar (pentulose or hexulose) kinase